MGFVNNKNEELWHGYLYAVLLFLVTAARILSLNTHHDIAQTCGLRVKSALVAAIYRKSLLLSNSAKTESTTGEIVNLMAVDAHRFFELSQIVNLIWSAPLQIIVSLYLLWNELGICVLGGLTVLLIMIPIIGFLTRILKRLQTKQMNFKDERVKAINEILSGIKVLKLYGWEQPFMDDVQNIRDNEMDNLKSINYIGSMIICLSEFTPFLVTFVTFGIYVLIDSNNVLTSEKAFVSLALFDILRQPIFMIPQVINNLILVSFFLIIQILTFFYLSDFCFCEAIE